ncbi:MAG: rhomboid family intramembrane serine protease [Flavobacteriaceae bacterium]|nr:rhomboid family intramembrane serine protease [Flavobacteriaceae bacterium]
MIKITNTVKHLIIINVLFYVTTLILKDDFFHIMAMHYMENPQFKPWQIFTHMFMHGSEMHILFNMLGLWMFGSAVEQMLGRNKFLILYFGAGIGAVLFSAGIDHFQFNAIYNKLLHAGLSIDEIQLMLNNGEYNTQILTYVTKEDLGILYTKYRTALVGASGALYGIIVAFGVLMPRAKMGLLFLPIMIEARIFIPLLLLYDISFGVFRVSSNIGHFAHVGGAITGFILIWYLKKYQFKR